MASDCRRWTLRGLLAVGSAHVVLTKTCHQYCAEKRAGPGKIRGLNSDGACTGTCAANCVGRECFGISAAARSDWTDYGLDCSNLQGGGSKYCCCDYAADDPLALLKPMPSTSCSQYCAENGAGNGTLRGLCGSAQCSYECNSGALCKSATAAEFTDFDQDCGVGSKVCCCDKPAGGVYMRLRLGNNTHGASCSFGAEPLLSLWFPSNTDFRGGGCVAVDSSFANTMRSQFGHEMWFTRSNNGSYSLGSFRFVCNSDGSQSFSVFESTDCTGSAQTLGSFSVNQGNAATLFRGECATTLEEPASMTAQFAQFDIASIVTHLTWSTADLKSPCDAADVVADSSVSNPARLYVKILSSARRLQVPTVILGLILPCILAVRLP